MTTDSHTPGRPTPSDQAELEALIAQADGEYAAGRLADATVTCQRILAIVPHHPEGHNLVADLLAGQGRLDEAVAHYEQALTFKPDYFQACDSLGTVLRRQGKLTQAGIRFQQAIALRPDLVGPVCSLGNVLAQLDRLSDAEEVYRHALTVDPTHLESHNNLAMVLRRQGKLDQAIAQLESTIAERPDSPETFNKLGNLLYQQGRMDAAMARFDQALALRPDYAQAHFDRADLKTFKQGDADLAALESLAANPGRLKPRQQVYVHFALGKALEDTGDYARAFEQWQRGNALKRREIDYDEAAHLGKLERVARYFDRPLFDRFRGMGEPSPAPIFIVGMPRSGSTLLEQILASHPQIQAQGELGNLGRLVRGVSNPAGRRLRYPEFVESFEVVAWRNLGQAYLASLPTLAAGKKRIVDKTLSNFVHVGLIHLMLPNARIIHMRRDPVATCLSCFATLFTHGQPFSYDLAELGRLYRGYQRLMDHWRRVLPADALLEVAYEDEVNNLEEQTRRVIEYCGLPWDDRCLRFHETNRPIATASGAQVRRPLYSSSVERWRRYEQWLGPLLAELDLDSPRE